MNYKKGDKIEIVKVIKSPMNIKMPYEIGDVFEIDDISYTLPGVHVIIDGVSWGIFEEEFKVIKPEIIQSSERINKNIKIYYGKHTMSFNENGDIKINDRLLTNDEEIVDALRMLLNLK